jgi:lipopolysaccharide transport system permease protein
MGIDARSLDMMSTSATPIGAPAVRLADRPALRWLRTLTAHRDLLYTLVQREIKVRYKQSVMGFLWAILLPLLIVGAGMVVRIAMARLSESELAIGELAMVTVKAVPWAFFVASIRQGTLSLITNSNLVTKIYMPREVFPIAAVLSALFDFLIAAATVAIILPFLGIRLHASMLALPVLLIVLVLLAAAAALIFSAGALFFRDVKYLVEVFVTFAIFFTPVFYEATLFGEWAPLLLLNPVAPLLEAIGAAVVGTPFPSFGWILYSCCFAVLAFVLALVGFKQVEPYFAESV